MKKQLIGTQLDEDALLKAQNAVVEDYVKRGLILMEDMQKVHMFFSPYRVPIGLTKKQLAIVLEVSPLREWQRKRLPPGPSASIPPFYFKPDEPMSPQKFSAGIQKYLTEVASEITKVRAVLFNNKKRNPHILDHLRIIAGGM
jgi:hypothetical protein